MNVKQVSRNYFSFPNLTSETYKGIRRNSNCQFHLFELQEHKAQAQATSLCCVLGRDSKLSL